MRRCIGTLCWFTLFVAFMHSDGPPLHAADAPVGSASTTPVWRVLPAGELPADERLKPLRNLKDAYHPWQPAATKAEWERQAEAIRTRLLVSNGLWPMPPKPALNPVIHGKIERAEYTIEKVYFSTHPGHYVTGNLYRPKKISGRIPGVLCPHGHWTNGRFYDAGDKKAADQLKQGAETFDAGAHFPLQARMVQLARMGCTVFHYDMVGYADSTQIAHRAGFTDAEAGLRLQNFMGLQTYNSIRALDFLLSLPEVDSSRIAVTGASGGGTQTFILCAIDPRPTVAFPAVMVSTGMQGGCICENADYLRIGINNVAFAALFVPKPLAMSGADDWSIEIETKGLPELKQVYAFYGKADNVYAKCFPQFKHNYNQVSRELMYGWLNQHLKLGQPTPVKERDFQPVPPAELSVFDEQHPRPSDAGDATQLRKYLTQVANEQFASLLPKRPSDCDRYRQIVASAASILFDTEPANSHMADADVLDDMPFGSVKLLKGTVTRSGEKQQVPWVLLQPPHWTGDVVLWLDDEGKSCLFTDDGKMKPAVKRLTDAGSAVASADLFRTGEFIAEGQKATLPEVDERYSGYTFGYNRPVLSDRVRDIVTLVGALMNADGVQSIRLVGTGAAGAWTVLARGLCDGRVNRTIVNLSGFGFGNVTSIQDAMYLPGALKYGGIGGLAALAAPGRLTVAGVDGHNAAEIEPLKRVYHAVGAKPALEPSDLTDGEIVDALLE